ncbi:MAG: PepSY domain-containing protein [Alphaproteobacteria bacterium]|nr:PepSY domain-containing protein [Alphaproteobacteria bacterium]
MQKVSHVLAAAGFAVGLVVAGSAYAYPGQHYAHAAKITMAQARGIALKVEHGRIVSGELEREAGGSGLRYSFDIRTGKVTHEVGIDAKTGKVLENSIEGPNAD